MKSEREQRRARTRERSAASAKPDASRCRRWKIASSGRDRERGERPLGTHQRRRDTRAPRARRVLRVRHAGVLRPIRSRAARARARSHANGTTSIPLAAHHANALNERTIARRADAAALARERLREVAASRARAAPSATKRERPRGPEDRARREIRSARTARGARARAGSSRRSSTGSPAW